MISRMLSRIDMRTCVKKGSWTLAVFAVGFVCAWLLSARDYLPSLSSGDSREGSVRTHAERSAQRQLKLQEDQRIFEAFADKVAQDPASLSLEAYYMGVDKMDAAQRQSLLAILETMPPGRQRDEKMGIFMWIWAKKAPKDLMAYGETLPLGEQRNQLVQMGLNYWAKEDPQAVIGWIKERSANEYPSLIEKYQRILIEGWVSENPAQALDYVRTLPSSTAHERDIAANNYRMILQSMTALGDIQGAMDTLSGIQDESLRQKAGISLAQGWANFSPEAATAWAANTLTDDTRSQALASAFNVWSRRQPEAAMQWAMQLPDSDPSRDPLLAQSVRAWASVDVDAAAQWINTQPASPTRDGVIAQFVGQASIDDPAGAMTWAAQISDESARLRSQKRAMNAWIATDPQQARAYLESATTFSDKDKATFLKRLAQE